MAQAYPVHYSTVNKTHYTIYIHNLSLFCLYILSLVGLLLRLLTDGKVELRKREDGQENPADNSGDENRLDGSSGARQRVLQEHNAASVLIHEVSMSHCECGSALFVEVAVGDSLLLGESGFRGHDLDVSVLVGLDRWPGDHTEDNTNVWFQRCDNQG